MRTGQGTEPMLPQPEHPFTLVIELDPWNIRQGDDWRQSAQRRAHPQRRLRADGASTLKARGKGLSYAVVAGADYLSLHLPLTRETAEAVNTGARAQSGPR